MESMLYHTLVGLSVGSEFCTLHIYALTSVSPPSTELTSVLAQTPTFPNQYRFEETR